MPKAQMLNVPQPTRMLMTASLAASAAAGTVFTFTIFQNGASSSGLNPAIVPSNQKWFILNLEVPSAVTPDFIFGMKVNGTAQPLALDANTTVPTNSGRVQLSEPINGYAAAIEIPPSATVEVTGYTLAANGTSAVTYNAYMSVLLVPI